MTDPAQQHTSHPSGLPLSHWLTVAEGLLAARIGASLEEHGLTRPQWQVLNALTTSPLSAAEIRSGFEAEVRDAVADQLDELVEAGWVTVEGELFTLTATGRAAGERVGEAVERLRGDATADLPAEHYGITVATLRAIARNLGHPEA
ncbi:MarR family winged helix-turn-helix transcriptional regulator [Micrococcus sp.]|uniref:MarR family winged helix-turn-helix transcriptional regulator n=1 Tax=Micrococcus sp. TaxID=1271 RepID=UPI0026DC5F1E|nr:MarR family transcriptional regulator [Micrococcus sp.]MDO4239324.1 MarR family transcriptional regulator [Micrococcus sp.]